ncbi:MAG: alpha/beta fold hydrolase [Janthinobacterium lividum]
MVETRTSFVEIGGSRMTYIESGSGPTVLLGSSYLWDADMWRPQIEALSRRFRVIAPDLWGHGGSGALPAGTRDMRDLAHQHLALLDALRIERCAVVGLSVGGMWGAELALMAPERVERLALMATSLAAEPDDSRDRYFALLDTIAALGALPEPVRAAVVPLFFSPRTPERRPDLVAAFDAGLRDWPGDRLVDSVVPLGRIIFGRRDAMDDLGDLSMPCLVVTGEDDSARTPGEGRAMAERIGCPFLAVPGAGHIANLEAPEIVNAALLEFLAA